MPCSNNMGLHIKCSLVGLGLNMDGLCLVLVNMSYILGSKLKSNHSLGMCFYAGWREQETNQQKQMMLITDAEWKWHMGTSSHNSKPRGNGKEWYTSPTAKQSKVGQVRKNHGYIPYPTSGNLITEELSLIPLWYFPEANKMLLI